MIAINNNNYREIPSPLAEKNIVHKNQIWIETNEPKYLNIDMKLKTI